MGDFDKFDKKLTRITLARPFTEDLRDFLVSSKIVSQKSVVISGDALSIHLSESISLLILDSKSMMQTVLVRGRLSGAQLGVIRFQLRGENANNRILRRYFFFKAIIELLNEESVRSEIRGSLVEVNKLIRRLQLEIDEFNRLSAENQMNWGKKFRKISIRVAIIFLGLLVVSNLVIHLT